MKLEIYPITDFVAEVGSIDLSQIASVGQQEQLFAAVKKFSVLIFPNQDLTQEQHVNFSQLFGRAEISIESNLEGASPRIQKELSDVSNLRSSGDIWTIDSKKRKLLLANRLWHTDSSFRSPSAYLTFLYARSIPPVGGHTEFANTVAAFETLDSVTKQQLRLLTAEHSIFASRNKLGFYNFSQQELESMPTVQHPMVLKDFELQKESLYISSHIGAISGLNNNEGQKLLSRLFEHCTQRQFVYTHRWRQNDLVVWNNYSTLHRGTEFDDLTWPRDFQRCTVIKN